MTGYEQKRPWTSTTAAGKKTPWSTKMPIVETILDLVEKEQTTIIHGEWYIRTRGPTLLDISLTRPQVRGGRAQTRQVQGGSTLINPTRLPATPIAGDTPAIQCPARPARRRRRVRVRAVVSVRKLLYTSQVKRIPCVYTMTKTSINA